MSYNPVVQILIKIIGILIAGGILFLIVWAIKGRITWATNRKKQRELRRMNHGRPVTQQRVNQQKAPESKPLSLLERARGCPENTPATTTVGTQVVNTSTGEIIEEDFTCEPKEANCLVYSSALKGGLHYEDIPDELIPEGSQPWQIEFAGNRWMHFLEKSDHGVYSTYEPGDEILQYPGDLLGVILAKEIKEFFKMSPGALEKIAFWAIVIVICVSLFIGFIVVTSH